MKSILGAILAVLVLSGISVAKELPNAPSASGDAATPDPAFYAATTSSSRVQSAPRAVERTRVVDLKFASLALVSTGSTFADSYTTLFARENWLAGRKGVCNEEVESAYLYGTHPTVGRTYAVAAVKSATSLAAAYLLRKHHSKLWSLPLITNSVISLQGVTQNMIECN
ncbi:MAG TPA: hypothetical protein VMF10_03370 [Candidatus Aquilonibacter sp.]|nr:hypothetical protein [Candidatus Aquilonibacter sp.]